jgi:hypothetical protein
MAQLSPLEQAYAKVVVFLKKVRSQGRTNSEEWQGFEASLAPLPLALLRSVSVWTMENLEHHRPELVRPRALHPTEAESVQPEAHGALLEALRVGMISAAQGENILEELVDFEQVQVYPELMHEAVARIWAHNIRNYQKIQLN